MLKFIFLFAGLLVPEFLLAQDAYKVKGQVFDKKDQSSLIGASVLLYPVSDTTKWLPTTTDVNGDFLIDNVKPDSYRLKISYVGFESTIINVKINNADYTIGKIQLSPSGISLQNVEVAATQSRVEQKGDTTQYNANAYKTNPDASAEDLLKKMPGVTTEGGTVKVNGEEIKQVLVNGKTFFGDDAGAALKNLPADVIDKFQVYDRQSDQSRFSGFDDGNSNKTINIVTKKEMSTGHFGRVYMGYGTDDRYIAGANYNTFKGERKISIIGQTNNVNQQNFSSSDLQGMSGGSSSSRGGRGGRGGGYRSDGDAGFYVAPQGGINTTHAIGINYSDDLSAKLKVAGSYFFNANENIYLNQLSRDYVSTRPSEDIFYIENKRAESNGNSHRANLRVEYDIDSSQSIIIQPRLSVSSSNEESQLLGTNISTENVLLNKTSNRNHPESFSYNFSNNLLYKYKFNKSRRTFSFNISTDANDRTSEEILFSETVYYTFSDTTFIDQFTEQGTKGYTVTGNLSYTEPVGISGMVQLSYNPSYTKNESLKETYRRPSIERDDRILDTLLSNDFSNIYQYQRGGLSYQYNKEKVNLNVGLNYQLAQLQGKVNFPLAYTVKERFENLLPYITYNYRMSKLKNFRVIYKTSANPPSVTQLQNVIDNSNPVLLKTGNPNLKQDFNQMLILRFGSTNPEKGKGFFGFLFTNYVNNFIANQTLIPRADTILENGFVLQRGTQLTRPVNLPDYFNSRLHLTYAIPVTKLKSNVNLNSGFNFSNRPGKINNSLNYSRNYTISNGITIASNISEKLDFNLSYYTNYNIVENTLRIQADNNFFSHSASFFINAILPKGLVLSSSLSHTLYSGLTQSFNQDFLLWNSSIAYKFLKDKSLEAKVSVFDILKQNNSISRNVTETYIEDTQTNILRQYLMFTLTYTLKKFGGSKSPIEEKKE